RVVGLAAGSNRDLLAEQVERYRPELGSVRNAADVGVLRDRIHENIEIVCDASAVASMSSADVVIAAIVGAAGIAPVYAALRAGKRVAIANKEVLVAAGDVMTRAAREHGGEILPVDSEHNAVHQALRCGASTEVLRIILTASGGPFLKRDLATFDDISIEAALAHLAPRPGQDPNPGVPAGRSAALSGRRPGLCRLPRRRVRSGRPQRRQRDRRGALPGRRTSLHRNRRVGRPRAGEALLLRGA